ncbi:MAG: phosphoribosylformylglycinamidine synthase I [Candidatus Cloacimonas sp. 4484_209]|nr:MAG: phosphoribosylformylglycinamidine synthase I [Candidatus Cloacimonas sp. 4484_209]
MVKNPTVCVLKSAGTNCELETKTAFEYAGAKAEIVLTQEIYNKGKNLQKYHILVFPGGFSYGDDIAAGKVWATEIKNFFIHQTEEFIKQGKLILGICNGFQVLVKLGLLPAFEGKIEQTVSLVYNDSARYEDRWVYLKQCPSRSVFVRDTEELLYIPVAHTEGKFITKNKTILKNLFKNKQIVFQYVDENGMLSGYPANPNGSEQNIAGICDSTGRVLGLMPHPERAVFRTQYPNWRREKIKQSNMGLTIIKNAVFYVRTTIL